MSDAPETIWACESASGQCVVSFSTPSEDYRIEYRRADLLDSTIGAKLMQERAAALMETASENCRDNFTYPPKTKEQRDYQAGAIIHGNAAAAIRALPAPTDAEVLAAAMDLPQIKALRDALAGCLPIIGDLVKESGRSVEYGEEDAFRRGEWFESGDLQKVEAAYAALAEGTPT